MERTRGLIRSDRAEAASLLAGVEPAGAIRLVRAFSTYFHLANVAEQVHRGRELAAMRERDGRLADAGGGADRRCAGFPATSSPPRSSRLGVRPVFTAHPTEAARRTVLYKLRQIADLLAAGGARMTARLEETIDLLWQTDELRIARPDVLDEARNAVWYFDNLHADAVPDVLEELADELRTARPRGGPGAAAARVRELDRRRPRRQPERGAGQHRARARAPARPRAA